MGSLRELTVADLWRVVLRYRPVALTIAAIVVIVFAVPGRPSRSSTSSPTGQVAAAVVPTTTTMPGPPTTPPDRSSVPTPTIAFRPASPSPTFAPSEPAVGTRPVVTTPPPAPRDEQPLTVRASAWASQGSGTPLATVGVPEGTLPVGTRLGQVDKASFVRIEGTATSLVLTEDPAGSRAGVGDASVQACAVEPADAAWVEAEAMSFDDAPDWDPNACADGVRSDDGTWRFDLGSFASRTGDAGFALVPTADAPLDFQVTFSRR